MDLPLSRPVLFCRKYFQKLNLVALPPPRGYFSTQFKLVFRVARGAAARTGRRACHSEFRYQDARWVEGAQFGTTLGSWHGRADAGGRRPAARGQSGGLYFKIKQGRARCDARMHGPWHVWRGTVFFFKNQCDTPRARGRSHARGGKLAWARMQDRRAYASTAMAHRN